MQHTLINFMKKLLLYLGVLLSITACTDTSSVYALFSMNETEILKKDTVVAINLSTNFDSVNWFLDNVKISNSASNLKIANCPMGYHYLELRAFRKDYSTSHTQSFNVRAGYGNYIFWGNSPNSSYQVYVKTQTQTEFSWNYDKSFYGTSNQPSCDVGYNSSYGKNIVEGTYDYRCNIYNYSTGASTTKYGTFTIIPNECVYINL